MNWDKYSDQPYVDMDPKKKRKARLSQFDEMLKILGLGVLFFPLGYIFGLIFQRVSKKKEFNVDDFFGVGINLDKYPELTPNLLEDLGVKSVTVRVPLWEIENIERYRDFVKSLKIDDIIVVLMQSRELVENQQKLENAVRIAFKNLSQYTNKFQFGVAINRYKWGYYTTNEYLSNLEVVERVKKDFPTVLLIGSSVIDFEYLLTIRTLFNFFKFKFDAVSSLLYVDRRGAPENNQGGLNLIGKIGFLHLLVMFSFKSRTDKIYITETNWPLKNAGKYSPTSSDEAIDEEEQKKFLVRYYLLALGTRKVTKVYWHQLISAGFGLVDFRDGMRKRDAFYAFKTMNSFLNNSILLKNYEKDGLYKFTFIKNEKEIVVLWSLNKEKLKENSKYNYYNILGEHIKENEFILDDSPIYIVEK